MTNIRETPEYRAICTAWGSRKAKRSGVPYMRHVDEGLLILDLIGAGMYAKRAYCLHGIFQSDEDLTEAVEIYRLSEFSPMALLLAMEYRSVANEYLSHHVNGPEDFIRLSPLGEVQQMLIADKVQNRKDFELYHKDTHLASSLLTLYFQNWCCRLGVGEDQYQNFVREMERMR